MPEARWSDHVANVVKADTFRGAHVNWSPVWCPTGGVRAPALVARARRWSTRIWWLRRRNGSRSGDSGDPESVLRWITKSTVRLADELTKAGHRCYRRRKPSRQHRCEPSRRHLRTLVDASSAPIGSVESCANTPRSHEVCRVSGIYGMDLGIVVPVTVPTAVGVARRAGWATRAMYALLGWGALLGSAVAAMGVVMVARDDPAASPAAAAGIVIFAAAFLMLTAWLLRPLVAGTGRRDGEAP